MKIFGIIALSFLVIITSLLFLSSSICAVAAFRQPGLMILGVIFAALFLWATIYLVKEIARKSRER